MCNKKARNWCVTKDVGYGITRGLKIILSLISKDKYPGKYSIIKIKNENRYIEKRGKEMYMQFTYEKF